jgi:zinc transport system substrate-binding protein
LNICSWDEILCLKKIYEENKHEEQHRVTDGADPHIWLNPRLVKIQARTIADALIQVDPKGKTAYERNLAIFVKDLDKLDAKLKKTLAPFKGKTFMVFHPAWGYFADAYGLKQDPIEIEGKNPSSKQLSRIIETAKTEGVRIIFVQPQFSRRLAKRVAESIGGAVAPINPLARDYIANLEEVAAKVSDAMKGQK